MSIPVYQVGRLGKVYAKDSTGSPGAYATAPTFASSDAFRHIDISLGYDNKRRDSLEKRGTPGLRDRFSSHIEAMFDLKKAYLSPSGTIQTAPEGRVFLKNAFGAESVGALSTTVASGASTTGATLTSVTGLAIRQAILIHCTGSNPGYYPRIVTNIVGSAVTWAPALASAPANGDSVKNGVTYTLANTLPADFDVAHYLPNLSFEALGCVANKFGITFDGNSEVEFSCSGPAQVRQRPAQSIPGAFTTVGSPVTGITGSFLFNGTLYEMDKMSVSIDNAMKVMNTWFGTDRAQGFYRDGRRKIEVSIDAMMSDDTSILAAGENAADNPILAYAGTTEGRIVGLYMPRTEFDSPATADGDGALKWSFKGVAKEGTAGLSANDAVGNDEVILFTL